MLAKAYCITSGIASILIGVGFGVYCFYVGKYYA